VSARGAKSGGGVPLGISALPSRVGSGTVVVIGLFFIFLILLCSGHVIGWDATWRSVGVTPLRPHFFDMHVPLDYAACALEGSDPYVPHSCNVANFNIPPVWLWLGPLGLNGSNSDWLALAFIACASGVTVALFRGRSVIHGLMALIAILSPSVMMGVERGNPDLLILALVGGAALLYDEHSRARTLGAVMLISVGIVLKLFPMFSVALAARFNRRTFLFAVIIAGLAVIYLAAIFKYILLIRSNVPTTFMLSYGYKTPFLGWDHLRSEAGLNPIGLGDTWLPTFTSIATLLAAAAAAVLSWRHGRMFCPVADSVAGTAFLFGSGIYCGTFLLGTNFIYRLMFLLLCVPQLLDWMSQKSYDKERTSSIETWLLVTVLAVLWLNGNANGHTTFLWVPQLFNWLLFFALAAVLFLNILYNAVGSASSAISKV
jgi:hypothetical protein